MQWDVESQLWSNLTPSLPGQPQPLGQPLWITTHICKNCTQGPQRIPQKAASLTAKLSQWYQPLPPLIEKDTREQGSRLSRDEFISGP